MMETALVFDREGRTIYWHEPVGRSCGSIPDTRSLWDVLWENRHRLGGVAHSHPWHGEAYPSGTDLTTFVAIEKALGQNLIWPVVTFTDVVYVTRRDYEEGKDWYMLLAPEAMPYPIEGLKELRDRSFKA